MVFVNIVGMTGITRIFFVGSVFVFGEKHKDYLAVFSGIKKLYDEYDLLYPETVVTDTDSAEIKFLKHIFPNTNHIFCIFHVNNNILAKIKSKIKTEFNRENGYNNNDYYYYYYYYSNLRAHAVCDYGTLPIMRQDLSSYLTIYIYKYIKSYRMVFFYLITVKLSNCLLRSRDSEC